MYVIPTTQIVVVVVVVVAIARTTAFQCLTSICKVVSIICYMCIILVQSTNISIPLWIVNMYNISRAYDSKLLLYYAFVCLPVVVFVIIVQISLITFIINTPARRQSVIGAIFDDFSVFADISYKLFTIIIFLVL